MASHLPFLFHVQGAKGQEGAQGPPGAAGNPVSPPGSHRRGSGPSTSPRPGSQLWAECGEGAGKAPSTLEGWLGLEPPEQPGPETCWPLPRSQHLRASSTCQPRKESPAHTWVAHTRTHADEFVPLRSTPTCTSTRLETEMHTHRGAHTHMYTRIRTCTRINAVPATPGRRAHGYPHALAAPGPPPSGPESPWVGTRAPEL